MDKPLRKKGLLILLVLYWPTIFVLSHIPMPKVVLEADVSDKTLHFVAYFVLVFLLWGVVKPYEKVRWNKACVWWILMVVVWYGVMDEWLQGFVRGRCVDVRDFLTDLLATISCLILLTAMTFWPAFLFLTGGAIFLLSACAKQDMSSLMPAAQFFFQISAYTFFTAQWITFRAQRKRQFSRDPSVSTLNLLGPPAGKLVPWMGVTLSLPLALMGVTKLGALFLDKPLAWSALGYGVMGMVVGIGGCFGVNRYVRQQRGGIGGRQSISVAKN